MDQIKNISISNYWYDLPDERIAKYPLEQRDESKLLIYNNKNITQDRFFNLAHYFDQPGLLVFNNTKVIRARIELFKETGARIEVFCLEPYAPSDYQLSFSSTQKCEWHCIVGNLKKWKNGILTKEIRVNSKQTVLKVERLKTESESQIISFSWDNIDLTFSEILESTGEIPIPPYLNRHTEECDNTRYQTIYSKHKGSVAAPTAGLHFTPGVFDSLKTMGIKLHEVTLHVGAGTFKPVKSNAIGEHEMHHEQIVLTKNTLPPIIDNLHNITAVGTTSVRTLESFYWMGVKIICRKPDALLLNQWEAYSLPQNYSATEALQALQKYILNKDSDYLTVSTGIMIAPGYTFKVINQLITNFHQPKSTLLLLISAFIGEEWKLIYDYAMKNDFRFLSYGDSCFIKA